MVMDMAIVLVTVTVIVLEIVTGIVIVLLFVPVGIHLSSVGPAGYAAATLYTPDIRRPAMHLQVRAQRTPAPQTRKPERTVKASISSADSLPSRVKHRAFGIKPVPLACLEI